MDKETKDMFERVLEEIGHLEARMEKRFDNRLSGLEQRMDRLEQSMEGLQHEVNALKFATDAVNMLLKRDDDLESRIIKSEQKWQRLAAIAR